jgi:hypothetical protein
MYFIDEEISIGFLRSMLVPQGSRHFLMLRTLFSLALAGIIVATGMQSCKRADADIPPQDTLVFIMAGQSNMAGRGTVSPEDTITNPRILELDEGGAVVLKHEPNTYYQGSLAGLDCGMSFGTELLQYLHPGRKVLLVQCSIGSTEIKDWLGDSVRKIPLYTHLLARARSAMQHGQLAGILWHQGEGNSDNEPASRNYARDLAAFIQKTRTDLVLPNLPFYIGLLPEWSKKPYTQTINNEIYTVSATVPHTHIIPTSDLPAKGDSLHFEAPGQRELGRRYAAVAFKSL